MRILSTVLCRTVRLRQVILAGCFLISVATQAQTTLTFEGLKRSQLSFFALNLDGVELSGHPDTLLWSSGFRTDTSSLLAFRQNLLNLPQIQGAEFEVRSQDGVANPHVHWTITEAQTIAPLFSFGGVKGNVNFLLGINDQHLFGKGHELIAFYQNIQGEHNFLLAYKNPSVRSSRFGITTEIRRYAAQEPVFFGSGTAEYLYINQNVAAGISYRIQPRQIVNVGATLFREDFTLLTDPGDVLGAPESLQKNKLLLKAGHRLDRRNYLSERLAGTEYNTVAQVVLNSVDQPFLIAWQEVRHYGLIGSRGNWATRLRLGIASNRESPFAPFVLDSQFNIRGSGNRIDRGSAQVVFNLEYRHRLWRNARQTFTIQGIGFSDLGTWRDPGGRLVELTDGSTLRHFVGGGVRFISAKAKNAVLRLDYGVDVQDIEQQGFVVGFGQYF